LNSFEVEIAHTSGGRVSLAPQCVLRALKRVAGDTYIHEASGEMIKERLSGSYNLQLSVAYWVFGAENLTGS
jgi:hypothetical protein